MRAGRLIYVLILTVLSISCGRGHDTEVLNGYREEEPNGVGTDNGSGRPGVFDANSLSRELADEVWRVSGSEFTLRYDRGGVLFNTLRDGSIEIVDLDGADKVDIRIGREQVDSLVTDCVLTVNDVVQSLESVRMLKRGDGRTWYEVKVADRDIRWVLCLP